MEKINKGDIVTLKSGGPKMTVQGFKRDILTAKNIEDEVLCIWFKGDETASEYFNIAALIKDITN